ncbi:MAG: hypothetical protein DCF25_02450 [Leptolyngbya foveolarum]|uniref:Uncharacterized protein n=1 Tax=Leptolyngbya foveolarum TaxID=47253 RepID=A0A2W4URB0_9CYAN|nr:MAG: hypothetical protein DCF25_02450 [Leptolyngbya foveolarum]
MGKIYKVDFGEEEQKTKTIQELFESIQFYRSEGKTIRSIHAALERSGLWKKSLSSFLKDYYQHCNSEKGARTKGSKSTVSLQSAPTDSKQNSTANSLQEKNIESKPQIDIRTGIKPDMTLEEKRAISAQIFKRKREQQ